MASPTQSLPAEMKAIQIPAINTPYKLTTVPVPTPGPHDLIVKVAVASHCHTDTMVQAGLFGHDIFPKTASHEGSGTVAAVGSDVTAFRPGDRVMCGLAVQPCGVCADCTGPDESLRQYCARTAGTIGVRLDGCLAQYVRVDERSTTALPDAVSLLSAAPLACAGRTAWRGVLQAGRGLRPGDWLAVVGSGGGLGHLACRFARARGLRVVGVDARDEGFEVERRSGADVVVDARAGKAEVVRWVREVTGGEEGEEGGADAALVLADAPGATALAAAITRRHGELVQIAQPEEVAVPFQELVFRDIRIKGSLVCSPEESKGMLRCVAEHGISVETNPFEGLEKIGELLALVEGGKIQGKAVIIVDPEQIEEKKLGAKY